MATKIPDPLDSTPPAPNRPKGMSGLIAAGNLTGLPALSLP